MQPSSPTPPSSHPVHTARRAGTDTAFNTGQTLSTDKVNYNDPNGKTVPVGSFPPNAWGVYDMHGNAWEWCNDWYDSEYYLKLETTDPKGPSSGQGRVDRGGCFSNNAGWCRSGRRGRRQPDERCKFMSLRVVLEL